MNENTIKMIYTVEEVAEILMTNLNYVYDLIKSGHLKATKLGRYKVTKSSLDNFFIYCEGKDLTDPFNVKEMEGVAS